MVKRVRRSRRRKVAIVLIIVIILISLFAVFNLTISSSISGFFFSFSSNRPQYCNENGCVNPLIFKELPVLPDDFEEVRVMIQYSQFSVLENFTPGVPDYNYFVQPELYPTWKDQGVKFYTGVQEGSAPGYIGVYGYGAYPGDAIISPSDGAEVKPGMDLVIVTFFHAGWRIGNYQGMKLNAVYPQSGRIGKGLGEILVDQDPSVVENYFDVEIEPEVILLEPTFPIFFNNWSQRINEGTPPGDYLIGIRPSTAPEKYRYDWNREYRLMYVDIGGIATERPPFRAFIQVQ